MANNPVIIWNHLQRAFAILVSILIVLTSSIAAQGSWVLKKQQNGISVFSRNVDTLKIKELKVEFSLQSRLSDLAALILDIPHYFQWSYNTKQSYILSQVSPSDIYFYSEIASPWPASNRDLVVHLQITQDSSTKAMSIISESVPDRIPPKPNLIRVPFSKEIWQVTKDGEEKIHIEYYLAIDPGASAPAWIVNLFSAKGPLESFKALAIRIQLPKYKHTLVDFIQD